jgi:hypothetical protein
MMNPRLCIKALDHSEAGAALVIGDLSKDLQRRIAERYTVYPVQSDRAFEQFDCGGERRELRHHVFGVRAEGTMQDLLLVSQMVFAIADAVSRAWPEGALVMWRRYPEISEFKQSNFDIGKPDDPDAPTMVKLTIRLGSLDEPKTHPLIAREGERFTTLQEWAASP